jgi:hypothetical protein
LVTSQTNAEALLAALWHTEVRIAAAAKAPARWVLLPEAITGSARGCEEMRCRASMVTGG